MTYHTPLVTSPDFIGALEEAYLLADNIEESMREDYEVPEDFKVFPYR